MDKSWLGWVKENLDRGCAPEDILRILLENNFPVAEISGAMGAKFPRQSAQLNGGHSDIDYHALAHLPITRSDRPGLTRIDTTKLQLYVLDDFMTGKECQDLIRL